MVVNRHTTCFNIQKFWILSKHFMCIYIYLLRMILTVIPEFSPKSTDCFVFLMETVHAHSEVRTDYRKDFNDPCSAML
jgi:hypothetical protein